nr:flavodoxin family protein [Candidatus Freyarchaeota archaeon]
MIFPFEIFFPNTPGGNANFYKINRSVVSDGDYLKILGLVGSYRKLGNTEVLVREALMSAKEMGAEIEMLRLTDLNIKPCKGCMACVFKNSDCKIEDDANFFFSKLFEADGIILGSPIYIFGPAGIVKMIIDRFLQISTKSQKLANKAGAIIAVGGAPGAEGTIMPGLASFFMFLGIPIVDQMLVYSHGPGEILLHEDAVEKANQIGRELVEALQNDQAKTKYIENSSVCPICHQNFLVLRNGVLECGLCHIKASPKIKNGKLILEFGKTMLKKGEEIQEEIAEHIENLSETGAKYLKLKDEIDKRKEKYKNFTIKEANPQSVDKGN